MSAKDKRDKLFKKSRPTFRPMIYEDYGVLWAAYKKGCFIMDRGLDDAGFHAKMQETLLRYHTVWLCEDDSKSYRAGRGPIAIIVANTNGWMLEPHVHFFPWATKKNILRGNVAFFQMIKYDKFIGVCLVKSFQDTSNLFNHLEEYGVLFKAGKIPNATPVGDQYLFYVRGRKHVRTDGNRSEGKGVHRDGDGGRSAGPSVQRIPSDERSDIQCPA